MKTSNTVTVFFSKWAIILTTLMQAGCSVFGHSNVETAPYSLLEKDDAFEIRHYQRLVLVSTPMSGMSEQSSPFYRLFNYISGNNRDSQEIPMTAPVFMDQVNGDSETMAFVLPASFSKVDAPQPIDPAVTLEQLQDYTVASVRFSGLLSTENIRRHEAKLLAWIKERDLQVIGGSKAAGYNPPFTIPFLRRNEVLIPVEKP